MNCKELGGTTISCQSQVACSSGRDLLLLGLEGDGTMRITFWLRKNLELNFE